MKTEAKTKLTVTSVRLPAPLRDEVRRLAEVYGLSQSAVIREAVTSHCAFLDRVERR